MSILDSLSEIVRQEIARDTFSEVCEGINIDDRYDLEDDDTPYLHPLTGNINWQENSEIKSCPECNETKLIKWGSYREKQRYKCKTCKHTFNANSFTLSHGIKKIEEFESFGHRMFDGNYESLSVLHHQ